MSLGCAGGCAGVHHCVMTSNGAMNGSTALVTGATSGLGRAVAVRLAREGVSVVLVGRRAADLAAVAGEVEALGVRALPIAFDLADSAGISDLVDGAARELGGLTVVVNAAATDAPGAAEHLALSDWERVVAVNLTAPFAIARAAMPHLRARGGGLIVNISSVAGRRGWADASAYCSTKFALTGLTQSLAAEGRADDIRACVIYPGAMSTNWGTFSADADRPTATRPHEEREALDPAVVADLIAWMVTSPGQPVLNEVVMTPLLEQGWP